MRDKMSRGRFAVWLVVFTVGSVLLVLEPTSSLGYILVAASFFVNLPSSEWRRRQTPREVMLAFVGPLLIVGAAVALSLLAPSAAPATLSPKARPSWYRIFWAVVWAAVVVLESRRTFRKRSPAA